MAECYDLRQGGAALCRWWHRDPLSSFSDGSKAAVRNPLHLLVTNPHPCTSYSCTLGVLPWVTCTITPNGIPAQHLNRSMELMRCHADSFVTAPPILTYDKNVQLTSPYSQVNRGKPLSACLTDTSPGRVDDDTFTFTSNGKRVITTSRKSTQTAIS